MKSRVTASPADSSFTNFPPPAEVGSSETKPEDSATVANWSS